MRSALIVVSMGALAGCSTLTPTEDPVYLKLTDLEARLMRIEKVVDNGSLLQIASDISQLKEDTQQLRGEVETLRFDSENAESRQRELYLDVDQRLQALEQSRAQGGFPAPSAAQGAGAAPDLATNFDAGEAAGSSAPAEQRRQLSGTDQDNYQAAFDLIQARKYPEAATAFADFLAGFPDSPLADNAQYWLAETQYVQRQFAEALPEFQKVIDLYPQSAKIPDALLKVGYCNAELQQWDQARAALEQVTRDYPDTTAARLAAQRLERLAQETG